jgi:hypothetical protein
MKKIILPLLLIAIAVYSCGCKDKKTTPVAEKNAPVIDSTLVTDTSWGPIKKTTDFAGLQAIYGSDNVKDERICGPECADSIDVTRIYPEQDKQFIVYWKDSLYHKTISYVETYLPEGPYHTDKGLKIGSTLQELLKVNGKKISFYGFAWDYGGTIIDYGMGLFQNGPLNFHLTLDENGGMELIGEVELNTELPEVKKVIDKITISFFSLTFSK